MGWFPHILSGAKTSEHSSGTQFTNLVPMKTELPLEITADRILPLNWPILELKINGNAAGLFRMEIQASTVENTNPSYYRR